MSRNQYFIDEKGNLKEEFVWLKYIDSNKLQLYALQFANCIRIMKNDAVYIFDEVGTGKTIIAGLMAMMCLSTMDGKILIVSTPAQAGTSKEPFAPFLDDWKDKDTGKFGNVIEQYHWADRIEIINNDESNIAKKVESGEEYSLIIIDEAHYFIDNKQNDDGRTKRREQLEKLKAKKIALMTATPVVRYYRDELPQYAHIASSIVSTIDEEKEKEKIINFLIPESDSSGEAKLCCESFDPQNAVTRYFKDTVLAFQGGDEEIRESVKRELAEIWFSSDISLDHGDYYKSDKECLPFFSKKIVEIVNEREDGRPNRALIFTAYATENDEDPDRVSASDVCASIKKELDNRGINKRCEVITGTENRDKLAIYSGLGNIFSPESESIPDILIITYNIAEAGVNFPRYNYIVNYHISDSPAKLEQRFGRIDRLNSKYKKIHVCYWLKRFNTSYHNYFMAVENFAQSLLSHVPSRNALFSKADLDFFDKHNKEDRDEIADIRSGKLYNISEDKIQWVNRIDIEPVRKINNYQALDPTKIFYKQGESIKNIAASDCVENIKNDKGYCEFKNEFDLSVRPLLTLKRVLRIFGSSASRYFSRMFMEYKLYYILPLYNYEKNHDFCRLILKYMLGSNEIKECDKDAINDLKEVIESHPADFLGGLPFITFIFEAFQDAYHWKRYEKGYSPFRFWSSNIKENYKRNYDENDFCNEFKVLMKEDNLFLIKTEKGIQPTPFFKLMGYGKEFDILEYYLYRRLDGRANYNDPRTWWLDVKARLRMDSFCFSDSDWYSQRVINAVWGGHYDENKDSIIQAEVKEKMNELYEEQWIESLKASNFDELIAVYRGYPYVLSDLLLKYYDKYHYNAEEMYFLHLYNINEMVIGQFELKRDIDLLLDDVYDNYTKRARNFLFIMDKRSDWSTYEDGINLSVDFYLNDRKAGKIRYKGQYSEKWDSFIRTDEAKEQLKSLLKYALVKCGNSQLL